VVRPSARRRLIIERSELIKCLGKYQLLQYRKVSNKTYYSNRTIIKNRKRLNFNEFVDGLDPNSNSKNF